MPHSLDDYLKHITFDDDEGEVELPPGVAAKIVTADGTVRYIMDGDFDRFVDEELDRFVEMYR